MMKQEISLPNHVAIIPDGNRRWAKSRNLNPWEGHEEGAKNIEKIIDFAAKKGIKCLSFWGSSIDNLTKRSFMEKKALLDIYRRYFQKMLNSDDLEKNQVKVNFIGRWEEQFPENLKETIYKIIEKTRNYKEKILNFMLAYSGTDDMLSAIAKIKDKCKEEVKLTPELIKQNLMTAEIPKVDFLIRTGGEPHNSNGFLMWDTADSQLYFFEENFPDFKEEEFNEALEEYAERERRFGQ